MPRKKSERPARTPPDRNPPLPSADLPAAGNGQAPSGPCTTLEQLQAGKIEYCWEPYLPWGCVIDLVGPPEVGKTTFAAAVAADVAGGPRLTGAAPRIKPGAVLWYPGEESARCMVRPKLLAAGCPVDRVHFPGLDRSGEVVDRLRLPERALDLTRWIRAMGARFVFFDPLISYLGDGLDINSPQQARMVIDCLGRIADTTGCCILCTFHHRKSRKAGSVLDWVAGASAWVQSVRVVLQLGRHPRDAQGYILSAAKYSLGLRPPSRHYSLEQLGDSCRFELGPVAKVLPADLAMDALDSAGIEEQDSGEDWLKATLTAGEREVGQLYAEWQRMGYSRNGWWKARRMLDVQYRRDGNPPEQRTYLYLGPKIASPLYATQSHPATQADTPPDSR